MRTEMFNKTEKVTDIKATLINLHAETHRTWI